ncbi:hypothetical protein H5399_05135 [Tessaracoccus sp. MC1627]|uniref:hypothetical protein n=1 Tax=Tessaracoccus sp. MC1627 TaxID=2760312 RepID=UPI0016047670|nr:hypothetical protein [Tessaracoccus sp. MC1627]MBB1511988.1 hypothetical protein [Tessaracoccus sp. MC1627]
MPIEEAERRAESVATVAAWLAANLGQHLRGPGDGARGRTESMDRTVDAACAMSDLQVKLYEWAVSVAEHHHLRGPLDTTPETVARWLRQRIEALARWAPAAEMIDDLHEAIESAHLVAPWRPADRPCVGVSCPACHQKTLRIPAGEIDVWCSTCGAVHDRAVYDRLAALLAWEANVEQRLARAGLEVDGLATLTELHRALEIPRETLRRWCKNGDALEAVGCVVSDRSLLYATFDAVVLATRLRRF